MQLNSNKTHSIVQMCNKNPKIRGRNGKRNILQTANNQSLTLATTTATTPTITTAAAAAAKPANNMFSQKTKIKFNKSNSTFSLTLQCTLEL